MKQGKSVFVCCLLFLFSLDSINAQYYFGEYINNSITLRSDMPSKSVLVSNLIADGIGDMSPIIGAANWTDSGRQLECRSLLEFNYHFIPEFIIEDPSLIISAELLLFPVQVYISKKDDEKPGKFVVRRVLENWEDTATRWINQPLPDSSVLVRKMIKPKNKNYPVQVDVTKLVKKMLREGNNGFMITSEKTTEPEIASGQLFASPKFEDENMHPLLVINYRRLVTESFRMDTWLQYRVKQQATNFNMMQPGTGPVQNQVPVQEPVHEPVKDPIKTNPKE